MSKRRGKAPPPQPRPAPPGLSRSTLLLALVASDRTYRPSRLGPAEQARAIWLGKCIHCQAALWVDAQGRPGPGVTLEHIVPSSLGGQDVCHNLALACARCNQQKGTRLDVLGLGSPRLQAVIATLQARRLARWRDVPEGMALPDAARTWLEAGAAPRREAAT